MRSQEATVMKIRVVNDKCQGHAMCVAKAPDVYKLDDHGYNRMGTFDAPSGKEEQARRGARACPERVIHVIEE
jgi:ferredoxin